MDNVSTITATEDNNKQAALAWLRDALTSTLEVCPLSYQQKRETARLLVKMPNWLMAVWAESLNIDYIGGCTRYPNMPEKVKVETGKQLAQQYLEAYDAVPVGNCLDQLVKTVVKQANENKLPLDSEIIEKQVCALAWFECTADGIEFVEKAHETLRDPSNPNHPLVDYHLALANGDTKKIEALDAALTGGRYGEWVADRINEIKRWLQGGAELNIHWEIETLPSNEDIYQFLLKGGKKK